MGLVFIECSYVNKNKFKITAIWDAKCVHMTHNLKWHLSNWNERNNVKILIFYLKNLTIDKRLLIDDTVITVIYQ